MVKFIEYIETISTNGIRPGGNYGDWLSIKADTPKDLMGTADAVRSTELVAEAAEILGTTKDARKFRGMADEFKAGFNREFVDENGRLSGNTQAAYTWALAFDLLSPENQKRAAKYLVEDIQSRGSHLSTGIQGTAYLMPTLSKIGAIDTAYTLLLNDTFPSWADTDYDSIQGTISSHWKTVNGERFEWRVTVSANTAAMLVVPTSSADSVMESGQPLANVQDIKILGADADGVKLHVSAGTYNFTASLTKPAR